MTHSLSALLFSFFLVVTPGPGWLGVYLAESDGVVIREVIPDTAAAKAGLQAGDVMLAVDGAEVGSLEDFIQEIQGREAGDRVSIKLRRGEREQTVVVLLGERPESAGAGGPAAPARPAEPRRPAAPGAGGAVVVAPASPAAPQAPAGAPFLGISVRETDQGLRIDQVIDGSPAARAGLQAGEVLVAIGDARVRNLDQLDAALSKLRPGQKVPVNVRSDDAAKSTVVELARKPGVRGRAPIVAAPVEEAFVEERAAQGEAPAERVVARPVIVTEEVAPAREVVGGDQTQRALRRELAELRKELAELRELLEDLKKSQGGRRK